MIVIGLTGLAGAGKTTVAERLIEHHGFTKLSFAAPLKKMLRTLDPVLVDQYGESSQKLSDALSYMTEAELKKSPWGPEYRRLLQVLGTDCIRAVDGDFWVRAALAQVEAAILQDDTSRFVFDDCRFPNEAEAIRDAGFLWNVTRPGLERGEHESERYAGYMGEQYVIVNDSDKANLRLQADLALGAFL